MYTTSNNIDIITIPFRFVNCYLINYRSNYILVDTGYPKDLIKLHNKISLITLDSELTNLKAIIITHHHSDHSGAVSYLKKINPNIKVIAHKNCFQNMEKGKNNSEEVYFTTNKIIQLLVRFSHFLFKNSGKFEKYIKQGNDIEIDYKPLYINLAKDSSSFIEDSQSQETGPSIKIFPTSGHTNDSICIKAGNHILVGDTMASSFNFFGMHYLPIIFIDLYYLYESWEKILQEKVDIIIPSHGDCFDKNEVAKNLKYFKKAYKI